MGNFLFIPVVVAGLLMLAPDDPAVRLGILLVLLVPCTDWFITFTQLAGGDTRQAITFAPISLLLQVILLPFYLLVFLGNEFTVSLAHSEMLPRHRPGIGYVYYRQLTSGNCSGFVSAAARFVAGVCFISADCRSDGQSFIEVITSVICTG